MSTDRITLDDVSLGTLASEDEIAELFEGATDLIPDQDKESPVVEQQTPQVDPVPDASTFDDGSVMLINIRYPQQSFAIYNGGKYTGRMVQFQDGLLIIDRDTANYLKALAPHIHEEPREGHVFGPHGPTGFRTRNAAAWEEHVATYHRNL